MITVEELNNITNKYGLIETDTIAISRCKTYYLSNEDLDLGEYLFFYDMTFGFILLRTYDNNKGQSNGVLYDNILKFEQDILNEIKERKKMQINKRKSEMDKDFDL